MLTLMKTPPGIRNNNPGNLRHACAPTSKTVLVSGYCHFDTVEEGLVNLAWCVHNFYVVHNLNTIASFLARYAPSRENDLLSYQHFMANWIGYTEADIVSRDTDLGNISQCVSWMRGIIRMECGSPHPSQRPVPEWFTETEVLRAVQATGL